jgi:uncharacterized membrane protein YcaP (DUF421 family)
LDVANYGQIALELVTGFIALFLITKILGKTQITQITPFDFISALILGELVGNAVLDENIKLPKIMFALFIWFLLIYVIEMITQRFKGSRKLLEGEPSIVIREGKLQREVLKKNKLDINQLQHLLRSKSVFSVREVEYALLETDGSISVLKKPPFATPTVQDLNLPFQNAILPVTIIIDGEIERDNLNAMNKDEKWLKDQLRSFSIDDVKDVFYAEYKEGDGLFVDIK